MAALSGAGITVDLPAGWNGVIEGGRLALQLDDGAQRHAVMHLANFPLPEARGDFGSSVVGSMGPADILIVLKEFDPEAAKTPLFAAEGLPRAPQPDDFLREMLQRPMEGQGGMQRFFTEAGRAFCLYVVIGSFIDRADLVPALAQILARMEIES
ncbi:MAG: hypothetical protein Q8Q52_07250 [Acidimicrobiia bacterium]|nr:hypothetical protein [Acidimicrobiia bacterium]